MTESSQPSTSAAAGLNPIAVLCPHCGTPLEPSHDQVVCAEGHRFPLVLGRIVDLLPGETDSAVPNYEELIAALIAQFPSASTRELNQIFLAHLFPTSPHLAKDRLTYTESSRERNARMSVVFRKIARNQFDLSASGAALELGCGHGGTLAMLAPLYARVVGIDLSLPRLILAAKLLEEHGILHAQLVRASAHHLPFAENVFDYVTAINVMEHVMEPAPVMSAVWHLLRPGGLFVADSRNRYDLFFPEPHVKLRWIGFLPRRWVRRYVRWRTGHPYENIRLLSCGEWRNLLRSDQWRARILAAPVEAYGYSPAIDRALRGAVRLPLAGSLLTATVPSHLILAQKLEMGRP